MKSGETDLAEVTAAAYKADIEYLQQQNRELEAKVAQLQRAGQLLVDAKPYNTEGVHKAVAILDEEPQQSLAHIQADAVDEASNISDDEISGFRNKYAPIHRVGIEFGAEWMRQQIRNRAQQLRDKAEQEGD